ncbi:flagellar basal body P-ring formation chaperone FlgA [Ferrimonas balearica]|uniref:flagellar basal body P-ring formation chaperone FlgA n=1 Tax=Ferrimonas balearica TaxID=44012 RepID=UPI001C98ED7C|nr:flagellar basal body P-ring formation chaperone FlgA [Ferrimonas balearica]MBY5991983.1 flagellar basal body P-ring formation chaperone FlgA [Ferrimonas balearica]
MRRHLSLTLERELVAWSQRAGVTLSARQVVVRPTSGLASQTPCPTPPVIAPASTQSLPVGHLQRQVSCPALGWRYFVRAKVSATAELPVARHRLPRDHRISAGDLARAPKELSATSQDWVFDRERLIGQAVRRAIRADQPIRHSQLAPPNLVNLGDEVVIEASSGGFSAVMRGVALDSGGEGDSIRVRNLSSGKVITAYPVAEGKVQTRF